MTVIPKTQHRALLLRVARRAMVEYGLEPDFPAEAIAEVEGIAGPAEPRGAGVRDLRNLPWCSIDNDDSRDLDQLTVAVPAPDGGTTRIIVAVADVSAMVEPGSALDGHAVANTTSVYTPPKVFPMLPERLSTDLTSLNEGVDRLAVAVEFTVDGEGLTTESSVSPAAVRNRAKLAYSSVGAWLEGNAGIPSAVEAVPHLTENLRIQDRAAQAIKTRRHEHGALELETIDVRARFEDEAVTGLTPERRNRAKEIIENFMIAANGAIARFLTERRLPVMRRVVRSPERWQRIVEIARALGESLPAEPDAKPLNEFLLRRRAADPLRFPDLSLSIIKLLGRGEYVASFPGQNVPGHFALAVTDYTHSTAPNRRYPDLITQRLLQAALARRSAPLNRDQLEALASHCTLKEDAAQKVERLTRKAAAACLLSDRIGQEFEGIVTGASPEGTWVRTLDPPVEGRVERGSAGLDVGDRVRVKLIHTDPERGFIDFARIGRAEPR
ncbi:MAG: RNB domain-containing ribonuclease [Candidatus Eisenbacteria bacterium]|uniref:RNB domain-containing ribonuclease n=1 Tax=Eiseniibacteriota bacterium TaxID=2212470 RepID=A0A538T5G1_UNCEI|nr:MAG: RNB domain-containing ribonuclease [Candidatus Eisenbacteria bacterium]